MATVGLFFGGPGNEADISIKSARNITRHFDAKKHTLILIYWHTNRRFYGVRSLDNSFRKNLKSPISLERLSAVIDVAFPIVHGKYGEDGVLQGIFEALNIPYCGCRVMSSALCMDKAMFKQLLQAHGIPQARFSIIDYHAMNSRERNHIVTGVVRNFRFPLYVKPSRSGSSIGITCVEKRTAMPQALRIARKHDSKIILEEGFTHHREIEIAILGNERLIISKPGELHRVKEFYDYDDKYKRNATKIEIPARLSVAHTKDIQELAQKVYRISDCTGFARLDFFLHHNRWYVNEINTLPGFTDISMFPMLLQHAGLSYKTILNAIIDGAY